VVRHTNHLSTGFVGVSHLLPALSGGNKLDRAYQLLNNDTYPSWGFSIRHGATTIWERWDGWTQERGFQSPKMNSFNHYAYGSVGEWLFSRVAGIDCCEEQPGFRKVLMRPLFHPDLGWCRASYRSHTGKISSHWTFRGDEIDWTVRIPANCTADVVIPAGYKVRRVDDASAVRPSRFELGSGKYTLTLCLDFTGH